MSLVTSVPALGSHMNRHRVHIQNRDAILHEFGTTCALGGFPPSLFLFFFDVSWESTVSDILEKE